MTERERPDRIRQPEREPIEKRGGYAGGDGKEPPPKPDSAGASTPVAPSTEETKKPA